MKQYFLFLFCLISSLLYSQEFNLEIKGLHSNETKIIDSIGYQKKHSSLKKLLEEQSDFEKKIISNGYLESKILQKNKINDSTFLFQYTLGKKTSFIHIYIGKLLLDEKKLLALENDTIKMSFKEVESFLESKTSLLERNGFSLAKVELQNIISKDTILTANLNLTLNEKRNLNNIVIVGYDNFPKGIKKALVKKNKKVNFNKENIEKLNSEINNLRFVNQLKYPEILFTKDSTKLYVYLEKNKPNKFDGFIGFSNDENSKLRFNGYLDLQLLNVLNSGEKLNLYWKNDGKQQSTFNLGTEIPYAFKTSFGIHANLRIFKQDSTFQNTITDLNLGYYLNYNTKFFIGYQKNNSVDIQNTNSISLNDFTNTFYTTSFDFMQYNVDDFIFPEKTKVFLKSGIGKRENSTENLNQFYAQLHLSHHLYLNAKNSILLKNESYYLQSDSYIINELHRFGGINSIRGFSENSLQANLYSGILTEYRYKLAPSLYAHSITDYGYFQDKIANVSGRLIGLGFGFGIFSKNGLFNLIYANGSSNNQAIKLSNSIVHLSFKTTF